jgi:D-3-phosphoglycerate dehydrogenase
MKKILITEPIHQTGLDLLKEKVEILGPELMARGEYKKLLPEISGIIVRAWKIDDHFYENGESLGVISKHGTGVDNIDIPKATKKGIAVTNTPTANVNAVAEYAVSLMLSLTRRICEAAASMKGEGGDDGKYKIVGSELQGKTLGIIGLGNIGKSVAKKCIHGFGMRVIGYDPYADADEVSQGGVTPVGTVDDILRGSDYVTLHLPLTKSSRDLITLREIRRMKKSAIIVNTSRGGIVNEQDLARALNENLIAGAAVDVFEQEPPGPDNPLFAAPNVLLTPHIGGQTGESLKRMAEQSVKNLLLFLDGKQPENILNPEVLRQGTNS